jgi:hypothetical protein
MQNSKRFNYQQVKSDFLQSNFLPMMPILLKRNGKMIESNALLDTGSTVNLLPYSLGLELGAIWEEQMILPDLSGNLANFEARGLAIETKISEFEPVNLVFAWTKSDNVRLILGQINFFAEYDVCFFRSLGFFEIKPK